MKLQELAHPAAALPAELDGFRIELKPEQERAEFSRIINDSAVQLLRIVNDVLDISRIESGTLHLNQADQPVGSLMEEIGTLYSQLCVRKGLGFSMKVGTPEGLVLKGTDPVKLRQILDNLLGNALKFTETGSIRFSRKRSGNIRIMISRDSSM